MFKETQKFRQTWLYLVLAIAFVLAVLLPVYVAWRTGNHDVRWVAIFAGFSILLVIILMYWSQLETNIDSSGVSIRFRPYLGKRHWSWGEIKAAYTREYNPILEYGGWGVRFNMSGAGKAYNVRGNKGLQLELQDGKKILIGTQKPEEIARVLEELKTKYKVRIGEKHG